MAMFEWRNCHVSSNVDAGAIKVGLMRTDRGCAEYPSPVFKPIEFDGFKIDIIELLPDTWKLNGITIAQPVADQQLSLKAPNLQVGI